MIRPTCQICGENQHKYKCPACEIKYCSVGCYKKHKEECIPKEKNNQKDSKDEQAVTTRGQNEEREEGEITPEDTGTPPDVQEDRVPQTSLQLLGQSDEMKSLLENPHLRTMLTSLDSSNNPAADIATAMQIPIFTEFADTCLSIVHSDSKAPVILPGHNDKEL